MAHLRPFGCFSPPRYDDLLPRSRANLENSLEQALKEAADDATLRKIKRISYSANAATEVINLRLLIAVPDSNLREHRGSHFSR